MHEAERQLRRVIGYHDLARPTIAIDHDLDRRRSTTPTSIKEAATLIPA